MPFRRKRLAAISLVAFAVILVGVAWYPWHQVIVKQPSLPVTVVDDFGRNVTLSKLPQRIVSLSPGNTEILFALGLGSKVVGVTKFCDYPPQVPERVKKGQIAVVGGFSDPSIERIVALNPDLVLAGSSLQEEVVKDLEEKGITVIALNAKEVDQILADIRLVGKVFGKLREAENLTNEMRRIIDTVVSKTENLAYRPRVYYELWYEPLYSIGPGTWQSQLIEMAGGANIFVDAKEPYPIVSAEAVIELDPEIIVVPTGYMGGVKKEDFEKRPGWSAISAVKNGRIYEIDEDIVNRPGPRIVQGLEQLAKFIHPEIFATTSIVSPESTSAVQIVLSATHVTGISWTAGSKRLVMTPSKADIVLTRVCHAVRGDGSIYMFFRGCNPPCAGCILELSSWAAVSPKMSDASSEPFHRVACRKWEICWHVEKAALSQGEPHRRRAIDGGNQIAGLYECSVKVMTP